MHCKSVYLQIKTFQIMKRHPVIALLVLMMTFTAVADEGIRFFEGTWAEALAKAKDENRLIFLDAYASWCGPCIQMAKNVFPQKEVGDFYNENFIPVKIDMEKGEGVAVAKLYNVRAYPTLLFINWRGELVHRAVGGRQAEAFIELGKEALDDTRNFRSVELAYKSNPDDVNLMIAYAAMLKKTYDRSYNEIIAGYMKDKPISLLLSETGWKIMTEFVDDPASDEFRYLLLNRNAFIEMFGAEEVNKKIEKVVEMMISQVVRRNKPSEIDSVKGVIRGMNPANEKYLLSLFDVQVFRRGSDWESYAEAVLAMLGERPAPDNRNLNFYAWDFYQNVEDQGNLKKMASIVSGALKVEDDYALRDTYAALLFKTKNYRQALREAKAALALAKKDGTPHEETLELIAEIEKAMKR